VTSLPENAVLVGTSDFCKNAMFAIDNVVFSMQGHPEFTNEYAAALIDLKSDVIDPELFEDAHATLKNTHQGEQMGRWIMNFFAQHTKAA
jgi:GMP synthase-like glutamine amidotransferase